MAWLEVGVTQCELIGEPIGQSAKLIGEPIKGRAKTGTSQKHWCHAQQHVRLVAQVEEDGAPRLPVLVAHKVALAVGPRGLRVPLLVLNLRGGARRVSAAPAVAGATRLAASTPRPSTPVM